MANKAQRDYIFQRLGYRPSPEQELMHDSSARIRIVAGGERAGKSKSGEKDLMSRFFDGTLFWLVGADYEQTRPEYNYILEDLESLGLKYTATKQVNPGHIEIAGGIHIYTKSADDPKKLAGVAPDGILLCEAAQVDYETFLRCRGRVAEKRGWLLATGTFESSLGWYPELFQRGQSANLDDLVSFSLPTWTNLAIYPGGRQDPEILALERASSPEWFMERYGGIPCPPTGLVFNEFRTSLHTGISGRFDYDPKKDVYLWVDPGYSHFYAVEVAQYKDGDIYIVDEIYEQGLTTSEIITVCQQKPWWQNVIGGAIDIAATQHQAMTAPFEVWIKEGKVPLQAQRIRIQDGIERVKSLLKVDPIKGSPSLFVNSKCTGLISELGGCPNPKTGRTAVYKWKIDREGTVVGDVPDDKNNDACKALSYGVVALVGFSKAQSARARVKFF